MIGGEDLYTRYAEKVYRYLFALCGRADTAEELTQETFCRALAGQKEFRGECAPSTWLCAIAKRVWYQELAALEEYLPDARDTDKGVAPGPPWRWWAGRNGESICTSFIWRTMTRICTGW